MFVKVIVTPLLLVIVCYSCLIVSLQLVCLLQCLRGLRCVGLVLVFALTRWLVFALV